MLHAQGKVWLGRPTRTGTGAPTSQLPMMRNDAKLEHKKGNGEAKPKKAKGKRAKVSKDAPVDSATPAAAASLPKDVH